MLYGNCVQRLETVDNAKARAVLLDDAEPSRPIRRIRRLVYSCRDLSLDLPADFFVDPRWDRYVALNPGLVVDHRDLDWGEEIFAKSSALCVIPRETLVLYAHKMVHERALSWP